MTYISIIENTLEKLGITREDPEKLFYITSFVTTYGPTNIRFAIGASSTFLKTDWYFREESDPFYAQGVRHWSYIPPKLELPRPSDHPGLKLFAYLSSNGLEVLKNKYGYTTNLGLWFPLVYSLTNHQKITITL
jgi:hypothetical protein